MSDRAALDEQIATLTAELVALRQVRQRIPRCPDEVPGGELYFAIGERIRWTRTTAGLTQTELARRVELSRTSIVNIEQGRQRLPIVLLYDIADALGVEAVTLLPPNSEV